MILLLAAATMQQAQAREHDTDEIPAPAQTAVNSASGTAQIPAAKDAATATGDNGANSDSSSNKGTLNFVDADIESVIAAVGDYTNTTFIIDPRVKGTLTLVSEKPLTKAQALQLLASVLRLRGYTIVSGSGYSKVVPEADAKLQAGPLQSNAGSRVRGDQIATQVFRLNFEIRRQPGAGVAPADHPQQHHQRQPGQQHAGHHRLRRQPVAPGQDHRCAG